MKIEPQSIGMGALVGAIISAFAMLIGLFVKRDTALSTHRMDSRDKLTKDTADQLNSAIERAVEAEERVEEAKARVNAARDLNTAMRGVLYRLDAETTSIMNWLESQEAYLKMTTIDKDMLTRQNQAMKLGCLRIQRRISEQMPKGPQDICEDLPVPAAPTEKIAP